jgi:hypothetical protein
VSQLATYVGYVCSRLSSCDCATSGAGVEYGRISCGATCAFLTTNNTNNTNGTGRVVVVQVSVSAFCRRTGAAHAIWPRMGRKEVAIGASQWSVVQYGRSPCGARCAFLTANNTNNTNGTGRVVVVPVWVRLFSRLSGAVITLSATHVRRGRPFLRISVASRGLLPAIFCQAVGLIRSPMCGQNTRAAPRMRCPRTAGASTALPTGMLACRDLFLVNR